MFGYIALALLVVVVAVLGLAAFRPDEMSISRQIVIAAPPGKLYALIDDMHQFNLWNPYARKDPAMKGDYLGPPAGPGAEFHFAGNKDVGKGSLRITGNEPARRVDMELHMVEPMEGRNQIVFTLTPAGGGTQVTWDMHCKSPFVAKVAGLFFDMDKMIGKDFEAGLVNLKGLAEVSSPGAAV